MSEYDKKLMEKGYDGMALYEKNAFIVKMSDSLRVSYIEILEEDILKYHKKIKVEYINELCEDTIVGGFTSSNGHTYRTNRDDQVNMIGQKDLLTVDTTTNIVYWKAEDVGSWIEHTKEEWLTIYYEAFEHKRNQLLKYNALKKQIIEAETHEEIIAINW